MAIILTPPNFLFQAWLERTFPTHRIAQNKTPDPPSQKPHFSPSSILAKFLLDQSLGAAGNTAAFIALATAWQDQSLIHIGGTLQRDFAAMMLAGWRFWPVVTLVNLCVVPWEWRPVVGNSAGLCWGTWVVLMRG